MSKESKIFITIGCLFLGTGGALAAFGFHGPETIITPEKRESWFWAVDMQFYHGAGLIAIGVLTYLLGASWWIRGAGILQVAGVLVFAGLVYAETLGMPEAIGEIVPAGGSMLMWSWVALAIGVLRSKALPATLRRDSERI